MPRQISYRWRLRELMAARGMFTVAELMPHLTERGITLSSSQVHRLVSGTRNDCPCRCRPPSATSSTARLPT
ncbi:helix-turn-helix domain-containing protein [Streptomyces sp. NPDC004244]